MRNKNTSFSTLFIALLILITSACGEKKTNQTKELTFTDKQLGQLLVVGFRGTEISSESLIVQNIRKYNIGGVILYDYDFEQEEFGRNISDPDQLLKLNSELVGFSSNPPIIAVANDGGEYSPLYNMYPDWKNVFENTQFSDTNKVKEYARNFAQEFMVVGLNTNFHPILDLQAETENAPRTGVISKNPDKTTEIANYILDEYDIEKLLSVPKYFPGYSSDYHPTDSADNISEFWTEDFLQPYKSLLASRTIRAIQTSHAINENIDANNPGTFSHPTISGLLRDSLGFQGVVFSDDLQKPIITSSYDLETSIEKSLNAGVDILVLGNNHQYDPEIVSKAITTIQKLLSEGKVKPETVKKALERIDQLKQDVIAELCTCLTT